MSPRPTAGFRLVVELVVERLAEQSREGCVAYAGFVHFPDRDIPVTLEIALPGGAVTVANGTNGEAQLPLELAKQAAALVRATTKTAVASGGGLPRKIVRWRG